MRNLTIQRHKSFVGCLAKMKVYIEDPNCNELVINEVPCRKLGELKNGEEATFVIGNDRARVFVIGDKLSRNFCNDFYTVPEGEADVFLSGKNQYNPVSGNPFRFDGVADDEVLKNRKKGTKIGVIILIVAAVVGFIGGFISGFTSEPEPEIFTKDGFSITLTDEFFESDYENFFACYESYGAIVLISKETEAMPDLTVEEYGKAVLENVGQEGSALADGDLRYYEYESDVDGDRYLYVGYIFEKDDIFWLVKFAAYAEDADEYRPCFTEWARSVVIA